MMSDALTNAIKSVKSNISCAHKPMIHKLFSLPIGPNDVPYEAMQGVHSPIFSYKFLYFDNSPIFSCIFL